MSLKKPWQGKFMQNKTKCILCNSIETEIKLLGNIKVTVCMQCEFQYIENSKNYLRFKVPPQGNEGPIDDMSVWRRWYVDKINLKYSYRFFWNGKFLEPLIGDCSTQPPDYIKKLIN